MIMIIAVFSDVHANQHALEAAWTDIEARQGLPYERIAGTADCDFLFFGHTHLPYQKQVGDTLIVNTGSVGKPKDGDPRAGYVLLTLAKGGAQVEFWRVDYDVAARTVRMSGLPHDFAIQLETGGQTPVPA